MHDYGKIDILWLDGGWVRPRETVTEEVISWGAPIPDWDQQVDMPKIAEMAREAQPGLLIVDRTVHGPYENYQTPEHRIPEEQLPYPWESCLTLGNNWGYVPNEQLKTPAKIIHNLIEIVAKGGSLLLGVGPNPNGIIDDEVVARLEEIGNWMQQNGQAIYNTRTTEKYSDGEVFFTEGKDHTIYALARLTEGEPVPATLEWGGNIPSKGSKVIMLATGKSVKWKIVDGKVSVVVPKSFRVKHGAYPALAFSFKTN